MLQTLHSAMEEFHLASDLNDSGLDTSTASPDSHSSQDSPHTKAFNGISRNYSNIWSTQRKLAKALHTVIKDDSRLANIRAAASNGSLPAAHTCIEEALPGL